jgi:S-adenosylmethionine:tRNA ribosyltransferase-isomerase
MTTFVIPDQLNANEPPERRGIRRDHVKLMTLDRVTGAVYHGTFIDLDEHLRAGDLLVLNSSRTVPAVLKGYWNRLVGFIPHPHVPIEIRLARFLGGNQWQALVIAVRVKRGDVLEFSSDFRAEVIDDQNHGPFRTLRFNASDTALFEKIYECGEPVRYEYIDQPWALDYYQTVFAASPGSVEMPSAGRAFSWELLLKLQRQGIRVAYIQLHTGLSYLLDDSLKLQPEQNFEAYSVPEITAALVHQTKLEGGRIIAVGTTVVRALESAIDENGLLIAQNGETNLYISEGSKLRVVDGLITGFHEPEASHLDMLTAFVSPDNLYRSYDMAITSQYLWHEFGDMQLIL